MDTAQKKIANYLNEAYATEQAAARELQAQLARIPEGSYRATVEHHLSETREHADRVGDRLTVLGRRSNPLTAVIGLAEAALGQVLALGKAPFSALQGSDGEEKLLEHARGTCADVTLEIATYTAIESLARAVGDDETAALAASIRADEEQMLERLLGEIPPLIAAVARAEVEDDLADDYLADDPAAAVAATDSDLAIPGYRKLHAKQITDKLPALSQAELIEIDAFERSHKNRTTVLNRIAALRAEKPDAGEPTESGHGDESVPVGDAEHVVPVAIAGPDDALRTAADGGDGSAAFTLWEQLRETDVATAEGWLRTAAESGDVRAAYPLGTLMWERGDLEAAEAAFRSATADAQAAHALGLLFWHERRDGQAAVEWLDRAAQTDDPVAARDLGLVLREHGDLHGAYYWLSRAADRDGDARAALARLVESN